jgi:hypothetical protein
MANYVFEADPNFNRVILEDIEKNRVFVNSQLELDFYTAVRPGGPFNGSYWQQIGNAGVIPDSTLQIAQEEYKQKQEQGDVIVSSDTNLASLNLSGPDGDDEGEGDGASGNGSAVASQTSANTYAQGIPSGGEITKVGDLYYILYTIPDTNIPISYEATEQDIRGLFPLDFDQQQFKSLTTAEFNQLGAIDFGNVAELYDPRLISQGMTPWEGFIDYLDKEAELRPWLADEEMVFLLAESTLEGRTVTEAEWKTTDWWRTHTQDERDWLLLSQGKAIDELPADAQSKIQDDKIAIRNAMIQAGIANPPDNLINWMSNKFTTGQWSNVYTEDQIALVADPSKVGTLDTDLQDFISGDAIEYDTTRAGEDRVTQLYKRYLGPVFGDVSANLIAEEAGKIRNDADYEQELIKKLTAQKKSLFPNYAEDVTYEEFSAPWENFTTNQWGQQVDTTSDYFQEVLKLNDATKASKYLTQKGLDMGVDKVVNEALDALKVFGQGARIQ